MVNGKTVTLGVTRAAVVTAALTAAVCVSAPAQARGYLLSGPNGAVGARARNFTGANGGTFARGSFGAAGANGALAAHRWSGTGPNGGTGAGGSAAGWKNGVGGFRANQTQLNGPNGGSYTGSRVGTYNAQTGQAAVDKSRQAYDPTNGQNYGYTDQKSYTPGQGFSKQIDTDHHGDYTLQVQP